MRYFDKRYVKISCNSEWFCERNLKWDKPPKGRPPIQLGYSTWNFLKVLAQSEMLVLKDRELKETKNLYTAVKDMLALQPSPEIQQTLNRTQRALTQRTVKMKCLIAELSMRERQVTDLRLELERVNGELTASKQKYFEMKRALDAEEARRLRVPTPVTPESKL